MKKLTGNSRIRAFRGGVTSAKGFAAAAVAAGIKESGALDAALLVSSAPCNAAGTFTTNRARAYCVEWCSSVLPSGTVRGVFCNSGNANACTGKQGEEDTRWIAAAAARLLGCRGRDILVASTGVIGHPLPVEKIGRALDDLAGSVAPSGGSSYARGIMTTDTRTKESAVRISLSGGEVVIGGCCKGSGMIHPNMATMLAFITTDAAISRTALNSTVRKVVDWTFNNLTIDGDTSTNDMVLVLANGASSVRIDSAEDLKLFEDALFTVCNDLCAKIAEDGEGATKRIEINVTGAKTYREAKLAAKAVANSNLVKTAIFGNDPNWGRILCAIGYSGARFAGEKINVSLCGMPVCTAMRPVAFPVAKMRKALARKVVVIDIDLGAGGDTCAVAHTCDLTYDYIRINAEYHT